MEQIMNEMLEKFVELFDNRRLIIIEVAQPKRRTNDYKIIGTDGASKWDFTPMIAEVKAFKANKTPYVSSIRATDGHEVVCHALRYACDSLNRHLPDGCYDLYNKVRDNVTMYTM